MPILKRDNQHLYLAGKGGEAIEVKVDGLGDSGDARDSKRRPIRQVIDVGEGTPVVPSPPCGEYNHDYYTVSESWAQIVLGCRRCTYQFAARADG